jgi:hypothetical protein
MGCVFPLLFVTDLPRYYIPAFGLLALAFVLPIFDLERGSIKRALKAIVVFAVVISGFCIWSQVVSRTRWPVFTGKISRDRFLSNANKQYYPSPSYPGFKWLNDHASPDARVLVFDDSRSFYLERDFINSTPHQVTVLERWSNQSGSGLELREKFASEGITHILVNHAEIIRQQKKLRFTVSGKKSLDEFWRRYTLKVHQTGPTAIAEGAKPSLNRWVVVYRVLSEREAALPHETDYLFAAYKTEL